MTKSVPIYLILAAITLYIFCGIWLHAKPATNLKYRHFTSLHGWEEHAHEKSPDHIKHVLRKIIDLANEIKYAKKHVRGTKTGNSLIRASNIMSDILDTFDLNIDNITKRNVYQSESVCSEKYMGTWYGHPDFYTNYLVDNCTYGKPLESLITVIINFKQTSALELQTLIISIFKYRSNLSVIINYPEIPNLEFNKYLGQFKNVTFTQFSGSEGYIWNKMITKVKTPYLVLARDVSWFNQDARLDRLIRQIEHLNLSVAGGSFRNATGHWFIGCQQRVFRNFTLVYEAGYDESIEGCQFCDHVDGPFVIKTDIAKNTKFDNTITKEGLFEDFFLRLERSEKAVCPDSMFFSNKQERSYDQKDWKSFADLHKIQARI